LVASLPWAQKAWEARKPVAVDGEKSFVHRPSTQQAGDDEVLDDALGEPVVEQPSYERHAQQLV
jgi:hypothetical protein